MCPVMHLARRSAVHARGANSAPCWFSSAAMSVSVSQDAHDDRLLLENADGPPLKQTSSHHKTMKDAAQQHLLLIFLLKDVMSEMYSNSGKLFIASVSVYLDTRGALKEGAHHER